MVPGSSQIVQPDPGTVCSHLAHMRLGETNMAWPHAHKFAPFVLHGCILARNAGTLPKHFDRADGVSGGTTQWRAVWQHAGAFGYAHVIADVEDVGRDALGAEVWRSDYVPTTARSLSRRPAPGYGH